MKSNEIQTTDLEARIVRLEECLWFQERKLEELDKLVTELNSRQNSILRQLEQTGKLIQHMRELLDAQSHNGQSPEPAPPHYQQL